MPTDVGLRLPARGGLFIPSSPILAGMQLAAQSFVLQGNGPRHGFAASSNGLEVTFGF